jgi:hypothetical protein
VKAKKPVKPGPKGKVIGGSVKCVGFNDYGYYEPSSPNPWHHFTAKLRDGPAVDEFDKPIGIISKVGSHFSKSGIRRVTEYIDGSKGIDKDKLAKDRKMNFLPHIETAINRNHVNGYLLDTTYYDSHTLDYKCIVYKAEDMGKKDVCTICHFNGPKRARQPTFTVKKVHGALVKSEAWECFVPGSPDGMTFKARGEAFKVIWFKDHDFDPDFDITIYRGAFYHYRQSYNHPHFHRVLPGCMQIGEYFVPNLDVKVCSPFLISMLNMSRGKGHVDRLFDFPLPLNHTFQQLSAAGQKCWIWFMYTLYHAGTPVDMPSEFSHNELDIWRYCMSSDVPTLSANRLRACIEKENVIPVLESSYKLFKGLTKWKTEWVPDFVVICK